MCAALKCAFDLFGSGTVIDKCDPLSDYLSLLRFLMHVLQRHVSLERYTLSKPNVSSFLQEALVRQ